MAHSTRRSHSVAFVTLLACSALSLGQVEGSAAALGAPAAVAAKAKCEFKSKAKCKHKRKVVGPSMYVSGFSVNRIFIPHGATVTNPAKCDSLVTAGAPHSPGPPQNVYFGVFAHATAIPANAPTREQYSIPEVWGGFAGLNVQATLSPPGPWSKTFGNGPGPFESPPGSPKEIFHGGSIDIGQIESPEAAGLDGKYTWTVTVDVGPHVLTSTATITVDC
jgi:hypothetical protein